VVVVVRESPGLNRLLSTAVTVPLMTLPLTVPLKPPLPAEIVMAKGSDTSVGGLTPTLSQPPGTNGVAVVRPLVRMVPLADTTTGSPPSA